MHIFPPFSRSTQLGVASKALNEPTVSEALPPVAIVMIVLDDRACLRAVLSMIWEFCVRLYSHLSEGLSVELLYCLFVVIG